MNRNAGELVEATRVDRPMPDVNSDGTGPDRAAWGHWMWAVYLSSEGVVIEHVG